MKTSLIEHIKSILSTLQMDTTFEVYDCNIDDLPDWTNQIKITHEYLVCSKKMLDTQKLIRFTNKQINTYKDYHYWFEGEQIIVNSEFTAPMPSYISELTLPDWLDSFLFNDLGAMYAPDYIRYVYNLDLSKEEVKTYLGTYFPRSYTESFCIFDNLFSNSKYNQIMYEKSELSILDFGSGTGGEIVGLLTAISKYLPNVNKVNILAIDGNHDALRQSKKVIDRFKSECLYSINYNVGPISIMDFSDVEIMNEIIHDTFDFIISFKAICELISKRLIEGNAYKYVAEMLAPKLTDKGVMLLLDVTVKNDIINTYYPIYLNQGLRTFVNNSEEFKTLIPLSCFLHENTCNQQCFTQRTFFVTHSRAFRDKSKVTYRILGRNNFIKKIAPKCKTAKFLIKQNSITKKYCPYSEQGKEIKSFNINN